jgi:hypothetical protein
MCAYTPFKLLNQAADFYKIQYACYAMPLVTTAISYILISYSL